MEADRGDLREIPDPGGLTASLRRILTPQLRARLFRVSVVLKGADAALEIAGGIALLLLSPGFLFRLAAIVTQHELAEDPRDLVATFLLAAARRLSLGAQHFWALYLIGHGAPKLLLVVALLKGELWAYPIAVFVFAAFVVYQLYLFTLTHGLGLVALSLFDLVVIALIWLEYRAVKSHRAA